MYYIIDWNNQLSIYHSTTKSLSEWAGSNVLEAITLFNQEHWSTDEQPGRFTLTNEALLEHTPGAAPHMVHAIIYKLPSIDLDYIQQHYPELLI